MFVFCNWKHFKPFKQARDLQNSKAWYFYPLSTTLSIAMYILQLIARVQKYLTTSTAVNSPQEKFFEVSSKGHNITLPSSCCILNREHYKSFQKTSSKNHPFNHKKKSNTTISSIECIRIIHKINRRIGQHIKREQVHEAV